VGDGPPLLLVHGIGGDADQWLFCLDALAATRRVIAVDLPGFGRSDKPLIEYRIAGYVEMLERFLGAIGIPSVSLLGHSLGGWVVLAFALQRPDQVDALVLCSAAGIEEASVPIPVDLRVSTRANMRRVLECMFFDRALVTDALVDLAYSLHLERGDNHAIRSLLETLGCSDEKLDGRLRELRLPTLVLAGNNDALTPIAMAQAFHRGIIGSTLCTIPECGHLPPLEKPQAFAAAVLDFLRGCALSAAVPSAVRR
jgi:pyruvate dehydrogenase E2 component (dihydrolipoamide acetyltransferase)